MHHETGRNDSPPAGVKAADRRVIGQELGGRRSGFLDLAFSLILSHTYCWHHICRVLHARVLRYEFLFQYCKSK